MTKVVRSNRSNSFNETGDVTKKWLELGRKKAELFVDLVERQKVGVQLAWQKIRLDPEVQRMEDELAELGYTFEDRS